MYGKSQYPYLPGDLASSLFSHRGFHAATSSTLIDFTCRNTWTFHAVETLKCSSSSEDVHVRTPKVPCYWPAEKLPTHQVFQPVVIYPPSHCGPSRFPLWKGSFRKPTWLPVSEGVTREIQSKFFSYQRTPDNAHHVSKLSMQSHKIIKASQQSEILPGLPLSQHRFRHTRHRCPFCHVTCSNNGQMKGHLRVHTGEKPYSCDHIGCGKAFARKEELTRHRRIHSGIKPYPCSLCDMRFGRKDHLNKHKKTHLQTKERILYACDFPGCKHRFTRSDARARHRCNSHVKQW